VKTDINLLTILGLSTGCSRSKVVPLHAAKACGGVVARFHSFLTSELDKSCGPNFAPCPYVADKTALGIYVTERGWAGTNRRYGHSGKHKNIPPPPPPLQQTELLLGCPARSLVTVTAKLLRLLEYFVTT
jgi:hypothetical protein